MFMMDRHGYVMIMVMSIMTGMTLWDDYLRCGSFGFMRGYYYTIEYQRIETHFGVINDSSSRI